MSNQPITTPADTVRFSTRNQADFTRTLRKRVDAYFKERNIARQANMAMKVKTVVFLAAYFVPFALLFALPAYFWLGLGLWAMMGLAMAGIGMGVMHDANHGAYSKNQKVNQLIGHTLNLCGGAVINWKFQHNILHHTYTNIAGKDNDIDGAGTMRFHPHSAPEKHHRLQWFYAFFLYGVLTLFWALAKDFIQYKRYSDLRKPTATPASERNLLLSIVALKVAYFGIFLALPIAFSGYAWWMVVVGFLASHAIAGVVLSLIFQMAHVVEETEFPLPDASGNMEDSFLAHQLKTTDNFATDKKWLTWYSGGLNHQVEHNLFPNICHVHYPAIAPIVRDTAKEFGLPYNEMPTFGQALKSHIAMLKKFGIPPLSEIGA